MTLGREKRKITGFQGMGKSGGQYTVANGFIQRANLTLILWLPVSTTYTREPSRLAATPDGSLNSLLVNRRPSWRVSEETTPTSRRNTPSLSKI